MKKKFYPMKNGGSTQFPDNKTAVGDNKDIFKETKQSLDRRLLRELLRIIRQLKFILRIPSYILQKRHHDKHLADRLQIYSGTQKLTSKAFVLVLYQPEGISRATLETCEIMTKHGYSVFAISNCPITKEDAHNLTNVTWKYGSRPNYGYDVGAYRDGLKVFQDSSKQFTEVLMMNDSIMFPLGGNLKILSDLDKLQKGFGGLVLKTKIKSKLQGNTLKSNRWDDFVEAYFYRCNGTLIERNGLFWKIWRHMWLTPGRTYLKEGLISYVINFFGYPPITIASRFKFMKNIQDSSCDFLHKTLTYAAYKDESLALKGEELIKEWNQQEDEVWKKKVIAHINAAVNQEHFHYTFIFASISFFDLSFLKKPKPHSHVSTANCYLRAVKDGHLSEPTSIQKEELEALTKQS